MRKMLLWLALVAAVAVFPLQSEAATGPFAVDESNAAIQPQPDTTGVSETPFIQFAFNEPYDSTTVTSSTVQITSSLTDTVGMLSFNYVSAYYVTVDVPAPFQPGETVTITLTTSILSVTGEPLVAEYSWWFEIAASQLEIMMVYPEDGGTSYHETMVGVMFNKVVDATTVNMENILIFGNQSGELHTRTTFHVLTETYDTGETIIEVPPGTSVVLMEIDYSIGFLRVGETITVTLQPSIMSVDGSYLGDTYQGPYSWSWTVIDGSGGLQVHWTFPEAGAWDVDPTSVIIVQFDRPLDFGNLSQAEVSIQGSINGLYTAGISNDNGNDTRLVTWPMDAQFHLGEAVTVTLSGEIMGQDGSSLGSDYSWSFSTINELPPFEVVNVQPWSGAQNVPVDAEIRIEFSRPLHFDTLTDSVSQWFEIGSRDLGLLSFWYETPSPNSILLHTNGHFAAGDLITVTVSQNVLAADGSTMLSTPFFSDFTVDSDPYSFYVTWTFPNEYTGDMEISVERDMEIYFNKAVNPATLNPASVLVYNYSQGQVVTHSIQTDEWGTSWMRISHDDFGLSDSITVTLTSDIMSADEIALTAYEFGFRVRAFDPIRVQVGNASAPIGGSVVVPVMVENDLTQFDISSFQFQIIFDSSVIQLDSWSVEGTLGQQYWDLTELTVGNPEPGNYTFAAARETTGPYLAGTGVLVYLHFSHIVDYSTWNDIWINNVDGYVFKEDGVQTELYHGSVSFEQVGVVSGHVFYSTNESPVNNVQVMLSNWNGPVANTTTDIGGYYEFTNVPSGDYWLQFHVQNTEGLEAAITAMDASEILKHVTRITQLQGMSWLAGEVTWNGTVTAYDASHVLSFAVNPEHRFSAPRWLFPYHFNQQWFDDRMWISVYGGETVKNMETILAGDVTGNWGVQAPAKPAGVARVVSIATAADAWRIDIGDGSPVRAAILEFTADKTLDIAGVDVTEGWISEYRVDGETMRIALAGVDGIADPFELINIRHVGAAPSIVDAQVTLNDGMVGSKVVTAAPLQFALHYPAPNPFNPATEIVFELPSSGPVELVVTNAIGQHVRTLVTGVGTQGMHRVTWNGLDDTGRSVASGSYVITLRFNPGTETQSVLHRRALLVR